jgi:hypothetical protein
MTESTENCLEVQKSNGLNITDLDDDSLLCILKYVNRKTHLRLMLVCTRFEQLIGRNAPESYGGERVSIFAKEMLNIRRNFRSVRLFGFYCSPYSKFFQNLLKCLAKIGPRIHELYLVNCEGYTSNIVQLTQYTPNIKFLHLRNVIIKPGKASKLLKKENKECHLPLLRQLEIISVKGFEIFKSALETTFLQLDFLKICWIQPSEWKSFEKLIFSCDNLSCLSLDQVVINGFQNSTENLKSNFNLKKLILRDVRFPRKEAFEALTAFVKALKGVQYLELDARLDKMENLNNYEEILTHLLNLETMKTQKI